MIRHISRASNHVHQVCMTTSARFWVRRSTGAIVETKTGRKSRPGLDPLVIVTVADHLSGCVAAAVSMTADRAVLGSLLQSVWGSTAGDRFGGLPELLMCPKGVSPGFSEFEERVAALGVEVIPAGSGFASGIRAVKQVGREIVFETALLDGTAKLDLARLEGGLERFNRENVQAPSRVPGESKLDLWRRALDRPLRRAPDLGDWWSEGATVQRGRREGGDHLNRLR